MVGSDGNRYQVAGYTIDTALYRVSNGGVAIPVEPKVFDLLVYLIRHRERVLSREELFQQVWDGREVSDTTLSNHVKSARKILGDSGELQRTILTIRGRGYQFIAPVAELAGVENPKEAREPVAAEPARKPRRPIWLMPLATAILLGTVAALLGWRYSGTPEPAPRPAEPILLVVPIDVAGADSEAWQSWADELTRRMIGSLRQISGLVFEQATTFQFRKNKTHAYIRQKLRGVRYVLSGTLDLPSGRLTMELDDLATGKQLWSRPYSHPSPSGDVNFAEMQSTVTRSVTASLNVTILEDEKRELARLRGTPTKDSEALRLYVEGWKNLQLLDYDALKKAVALFDQAIARDQGFFDAYLAKGKAYRWIYSYYETPKDVLDKVVTAFDEARKLQPDSVEPLSELGLTYAIAWDWTRAWEYLNKARRMDPDLATTNLGFAIYYSGLGPVEKMKEFLYRARQKDPLNLEMADWGNWALFTNNELDASRTWAKEMMDNHPSVGFITTDAAIGAYMAHEYQRAVTLARQGVTLDEPAPLGRIVLAQAYGHAGQKDEVRPLLQAAASSPLYSCPYEMAIGYLSIGEMKTAMSLLQQAYEKRSNCLVFLRVDPRLEPIRKEPYRQQYLDLLALVGLDDRNWKAYPR
jgi:DNA-binding winged helix-turn-helix (wHTH) protein/TolB-like protein/tetratricopeptide (TPR) repeat protein